MFAVARCAFNLKLWTCRVLKHSCFDVIFSSIFRVWSYSKALVTLNTTRTPAVVVWVSPTFCISSLSSINVRKILKNNSFLYESPPQIADKSPCSNGLSVLYVGHPWSTVCIDLLSLICQTIAGEGLGSALAHTPTFFLLSTMTVIIQITTMCFYNPLKG